MLATVVVALALLLPSSSLPAKGIPWVYSCSCVQLGWVRIALLLLLLIAIQGSADKPILHGPLKSTLHVEERIPLPAPDSAVRSISSGIVEFIVRIILIDTYESINQDRPTSMPKLGR